MEAKILIKKITDGEYNDIFRNLYGENKIDCAKERYTDALEEFLKLYNDRNVEIFSVPGRSEILGNHTDHNNGCVLAAAIDLDIIAVVSKSLVPGGKDSHIRIKSKGFEPDDIDLNDLSPKDDEKFTSASIIRGISARFEQLGYNIGGFDAYTDSDILKGSGLSSSAAFEIMAGFILSRLYNDSSVSMVELAKIGQYAENVYFGKPCGLMDQTACACGGFVAIDFEDSANPIVEKLDYDLSKAGYSLCIVSTGGSHADLNDDYASITGEMKSVAGAFGEQTLRNVQKCSFMRRIPELCEKFGDRAVLRSLHFFNENARVTLGTEALKEGHLDMFLANVTASGNSSYKYLQNLYTVKDVKVQKLCLAIALSEEILKGKPAAARVHGGGFAGTIQAFIPRKNAHEYAEAIESTFGKNSCLELNVRTVGAVKVL